MKKSIVIMALAMMFAVVQGYAQRSVPSGSRSTTATRSTVTRTATPVRSSSVSTTRTATPVRSSSVSTTRTATSVRSSSVATRPVQSRPSATVTSTRTATTTRPSANVTSTRTATTSRLSATVTSMRTATTSRPSATVTSRTPQGSPGVQAATRPPQDRGHHAPPPPKPHHDGGHHVPHIKHAHHFHHHHCVFETWAWVTFLDYQYRFVRHSHYTDRFFDTALGYYVYGYLEKPLQIHIGNLKFIRRNGYLEVHNYGQVMHYQYRESGSMVYYVDEHTSVKVSLYYGFATVLIFDDYGNEALYYL